MNIEELFTELNKRNINPSARELCRILDMSEENFSRAKKEKRQIKFKNIKKIEDEFNISLSASGEKTSGNYTFKRRFAPDIDECQKNCGERILYIQNFNKLSNRQTAGLLDVSEQELENIISGRMPVNLKILNNIKQNFDVSIDWILYGSGSRSA